METDGNEMYTLLAVNMLMVIIIIIGIQPLG
jgi:hypothetical protein